MVATDTLAVHIHGIPAGAHCFPADEMTSFMNRRATTDTSRNTVPLTNHLAKSPIKRSYRLLAGVGTYSLDAGSLHGAVIMGVVGIGAILSAIRSREVAMPANISIILTRMIMTMSLMPLYLEGEGGDLLPMALYN